MAVLGPRARRALLAGTGRPAPLLLSATRMPTAPWRVRDAFLVLGSGLLWLAMALVVTLGLFQLQAANGQDSNTKAAISTVVAAAYFLFLLWMLKVLIVQRYRCGWRTLGLRSVGWQWLAAVPFVYALLTFVFVVLFRLMVLLLGPAAHWPQPLTSSTVDATQQPILEGLVILTGVVLAPLVEELLFRGVLYQALRRRMPVGSAALVSALIFALMHFNLLLFIPLTLMGLVFALVYERSGSLIPTILVHACNNGIILLFIIGSQRA